MPTVATSPSIAIHSCSAVYLRALRSVTCSSGGCSCRSLGSTIEGQGGHGGGDAGSSHVDGELGAGLADAGRDEGHRDRVAESRAQRAARDLADALVALEDGVAG